MKSEQENEEHSQVFKAAQKREEHLTHRVILLPTYSVLLAVKSLLVIRALIVLKCVTSSVL